MWRPTEWSEIEALIGYAEEMAALDFKRELPRNSELAKDVAAMTVNGGTLVIGVDEDRNTGLASSVTPIPLRGAEEKVRQVAGSGVRPSPEVDVVVLADPADASTGVLVIVVPPSPLAPHQVGGRYPCRRGTTTGSLDEPEVERLYRQRAQLSGPPPAPGELLRTHFVPVWKEHLASNVGRLKLIVRPASDEASHPGGPWQEPHLRGAVYDAVQRQTPRLANASLVRSFNALSSWRPHGVAGWCAGQDLPGPSSQATDQRIGGTLAYPARLSFEAQWGLQVVVDRGGKLRYLSAREIDVAREVTGLLAVAGEYFSKISGAGLLLVGAGLSGFEGGLSQVGTEQGREVELPGAPAGVTGDTRTTAPELRDTPELVGRRLIESWLPPFYMVRGKKLDRFGLSLDLFGLVVPGADLASGGAVGGS